MSNRKSLLAAAIALACSVSFSTHVAAEESRKIEIPAGDLRVALESLARQAGIELVYRMDQVNGVKTKGVSGELAPRDAAERLIEGTSLELRVDPSGAMLITAPAPRSTGIRYERDASVQSTSVRSTEPDMRFRVAQVNPSISDATNSSNQQMDANESSSDTKPIVLEEVLVTGSHIRGAQNFSAPVIRFDREDIERSGYATTQELIQSLPQNLNDISDRTSFNGPGALDYAGSGVNLRGLGGDSTLVLVNGRRLAAAGKGDFFDISLIPLSAVERVEVLTDGASAIYGSDAVGGVVNLVLRRDVRGAESRARYGTVTNGNHNEWLAGQMVGHTWGSGQALVSYEYLERSALDGSDRGAGGPDAMLTKISLIPEQQRHGALALVTQRISERLEFSSDLFYSQRSSNGYSDSGWPLNMADGMKQLGGALAFNIDLATGWQARVGGLFNRNDAERNQTFMTTGELVSAEGNSNRLWTADVGVDGALYELPGGEVRVALGGQMRGEYFIERREDHAGDLKRDVGSAYAEVHLPFVGMRNRRSGVQRLEMTVAARYEDYSDFGSAANPKIGLSWSPTDGLNIRSTWGTSFKAPMLMQLNQGYRFATIFEDMFVDSSGRMATGLRWQGNGENLGPQKSTNWTAGFDFAPPALEALSLSATYFNVDYVDRIKGPFPPGYDPYGQALSDPVYDGVAVFHNPDPAYVREIILAARNTGCYTSAWAPCDLLSAADRVAAIVDERDRNLAGVSVSGVDVLIGYSWTNALGDWSAQINGAYLLDNTEKLVPGTPELERMNDVWRPVDLRARASLSFGRGALQTAAFLNYIDGYRDRRTGIIGGPLQRDTVSSWTTLDLTVQYDLAGKLGERRNEVEVSIAANNILNNDPPFVGSLYGVNFDGVNASALGRFVSAQFTVRWGRL